MNITIKSDKKHYGECSPYLSNLRALYCKDVIDTTFFKSSQPKREFNIFHYISCKSKWMIYPLECNTSKSGTSVGKSEGNLQSFLNNHRKNVEDLKAIEANKHSI